MKKKIVLKKLSISKSTVASLNADQQHHVAGGAPTFTRLVNCMSQVETCNTIPRTGHYCVICNPSDVTNR
ncbi:class I lanthipeptide [Chitinophaga solisilvae]|uniref:class I lanthipeptide n=1 Tax=Chitinophaga solisilvae TaxID=1233460 RepID=UPI0019221FF8